MATPPILPTKEEIEILRRQGFKEGDVVPGKGLLSPVGFIPPEATGEVIETDKEVVEKIDESSKILATISGEPAVLTPEQAALQEKIGGVEGQISELQKQKEAVEIIEATGGTVRSKEEIEAEGLARLEEEEGVAEETFALISPDNKFQVVKASEVTGLIDKGFTFASSKERDEAEAAGLFPTDEATTVNPTVQAAQNEVNTATASLESAEADLEKIRVSANDATFALIESIKATYKSRKEEIRKIGERTLRQATTVGIRAGISRFSPLVATGIVDEVERQNLQQIARLDAEEASLIATAQLAQSQQNFEMFSNTVDRLEAKRTEKINVLKDLQTVVAEKDEQFREEERKFSNANSILNWVDQGVTDPSKIFGLVNFNDEGRQVNNILFSEITDITDTLPSAEEEIIKTFGGIPYRPIKDENGNIIRYEKVAGVETENDLDKPLTLNEIKAYNAAGANFLMGATRRDARESGVRVGELRSRSDLVPFERLSARNLSVDIFGKRAGTKAENIELIENLMAGGMTIDQISDGLRYEGVSDQFEGTFKNAFEFVTKSGFSTVDRTAAREGLDELLEEGDMRGSVDYIMGLARDKGTNVEKKSVAARDDALYALNEIESRLNEYIAKGGATGLLQGNIEKFKNNVLKRTGDAELAEIANEIAIIVQRYRQELTGAAFTESEAAEYARLFPGIEKSPELNQALIDSMRETYSRFQDGFYKRTLGDRSYNELINMIYGGTDNIGFGEEGTSDPLGIGTANNNQQTNNPLNLELP